MKPVADEQEKGRKQRPNARIYTRFSLSLSRSIDHSLHTVEVEHDLHTLLQKGILRARLFNLSHASLQSAQQIALSIFSDVVYSGNSGGGDDGGGIVVLCSEARKTPTPDLYAKQPPCI